MDTAGTVRLTNIRLLLTDLRSISVYAMMQFVTQLLWTVFFALIAYGVATNNSALTATVQSLHSYLVDILCLTGPICLFSTRYASGH